MTKIDKDTLITITEAAREKGVTRSTIYDWKANGLIDCEQIGKNSYIIKNKKFEKMLSIRGPKRTKIDIHEQVFRLQQRVAALENEVELLRANK